VLCCALVLSSCGHDTTPPTPAAAGVESATDVLSKRYLTPRGRELEGVGVMPDVTVALTLADLRAGRDAALEEAQARLRAANTSR
jgi:C-terminal processing protease CtpA/Prc